MKLISLVFVMAALTACSDSSGSDASRGATALVGNLGAPDVDGASAGLAREREHEPRRIHLGDPLPDLTPEELAAFKRGRKVFKRQFKPSEGLGPLYNATSCESCHSQPVTGGSARLYRNFYIAVIDFGFAQSPLGGLPSIVIPSFGGSTPHAIATFTLEDRRREIPDNVGGLPVVVTQRNALPLFGTGMFEFVSDATIMSNSDPNDLDGDGISGRFNRDTGAPMQLPIGRFGVKLQSNNIEFFTRGPLQNQIGITSDPLLGSSGIASSCVRPVPQGGATADDPLTDGDGIPDPEISEDDLGDLIAFTRFLAPPQPLPFDAEAEAGEALFDSIGCAKCHIPELPTSRGPIRAYTDLLLHEVGDDLKDGLHQGSPQASSKSSALVTEEFRTQPLWGVRHHGPFLHDGRAETLEEAIEAHGGEAEDIRDAFMALSQNDKDAIIAFLEHL